MSHGVNEEEGGTEDEWAELPEELFTMVLEALQPAGQSAPQAGGFAQALGAFSGASAAVRLVCSRWKAVHDARVARLVLKRQTPDQAVDMLVRRFPAVVSIDFKGERDFPAEVSDEGVQAAVSNLPALTYFNLSSCRKLTDEALRAVSSLPALTFLDVSYCRCGAKLW
jgi:hypothetical protein